MTSLQAPWWAALLAVAVLSGIAPGVDAPRLHVKCSTGCALAPYRSSRSGTETGQAGATALGLSSAGPGPPTASATASTSTCVDLAGSSGSTLMESRNTSTSHRWPRAQVAPATRLAR